jgi:GntR family transcriptional regulator
MDCATGSATAEEAAALGLPPGASVHRVWRRRLIAGSACILETILLPAARFPGFALPVGREMQDELYVLYQRDFAVTVARAEERLAAVLATPEQAATLTLPPGTPLLEIARTAFDVAGRPVERRVTLLDTTSYRYVSALD